MVVLDRKKLLGAVYALEVEGKRATPREVAAQLGLGKASVEADLEGMASQGFIEYSRGAAKLTEKGRREVKVVFIGGGFEVIHRGHLHTIEQAKALGDVLVVSVARDSTIRKRKRRQPISDENERVRLLSSLREVDAPILGVEGDIYDTLARVRPDVVALGYDQYHMEGDVEEEARKRGLKLKVVRLGSPYPKIKTTGLLKEA